MFKSNEMATNKHSHSSPNNPNSHISRRLASKLNRNLSHQCNLNSNVSNEAEARGSNVDSS
jgi:hypothetical protein